MHHKRHKNRGKQPEDRPVCLQNQQCSIFKAFYSNASVLIYFVLNVAFALNYRIFSPSPIKWDGQKATKAAFLYHTQSCHLLRLL